MSRPDGSVVTVDAVTPDEGILHMLVETKSLDVLHRRADQHREIHLNGNMHQVMVLTERDLLLESVGGSTSKSGGPEFHSPISGKVVALSVDPGSTIEEGQTLIVVEAMKMENDLKSQRSGVVSYAVEVGDTVQVGDLLATLSEPEE